MYMATLGHEAHLVEAMPKKPNTKELATRLDKLEEILAYRSKGQRESHSKGAIQEKRLCMIQTWEKFKRELKKHFYPESIEFKAYKKLQILKHTDSLKQYVNEYSALMLEIPDMPKREALYAFLDGLQPYAANML